MKIKVEGICFVVLIWITSVFSETIPYVEKIKLLFSNVSFKDMSLFKDSLCIGNLTWADLVIADQRIRDDYAEKISVSNNVDIWIENLDENDCGSYDTKYGVSNNFPGYQKTLNITDIIIGKQILFADVAIEDVSLYKNGTMIASWNLSSNVAIKWIDTYYARKIYFDGKNHIWIYDLEDNDTGNYVLKYGISKTSRVETVIPKILSEEELIQKWLDNPQNRKKIEKHLSGSSNVPHICPSSLVTVTFLMVQYVIS